MIFFLLLRDAPCQTVESIGGAHTIVATAEKNPAQGGIGIYQYW